MAKSTTLTVKIITDSSRARSGLNRAAAGFGAFKGKLGNMSAAAASMVNNLVSGAMNYVKGLSSEMIEASDSAQKFASTLKFSGVSDSTIKRLTKSTQDYADKTIFDLNDIRNTTAQLAANGVPNYDKLAEAAGNLTAVAGGGKTQFKSVAMMLTQTAGAGKLTTENWNQLADAIPGASGKLQEAMRKNGAYTGNFRDAMEKGEITSQEFNQALMQLGMSDTAKQAAANATTLEGASGNLEAAVVKMGSEIITKLKPAITSVMNGFANWVSMMADKLTPALDWLGNKISETGKWLAQNKDDVGELLAAVGGAVGALTAVAAAMKVAAVAQGILNAVMEANPFTLIITAIAMIVAGLTYFFTQTKQGQQIWQNVVNWFNGAINSLKSWFTGAWNMISSGFINAGNTVRNAWNGVIGFFGSIPGRIGGFMNAAKNWIVNAFNAAVGFVRGVPGRIAGAFGCIGGAIGAKFSGVTNAVTGAFSNAGSWLVEAGKSIINGFLNGLKGSFKSVQDWVGSIAGWIKAHKGPISYDRRLLIPAGNAIMTGFAEGLTNGFDGKVKNAIYGMNSQLSGMFSSISANGLAITANSRPLQFVYNVEITGEIVDKDGTAREIRRLLDGYAEKRR